jgi:hypothetical protein
MNQDLLCRWLAVEGKAWPPDPYTLVGVTQGECDLARIEQRVHERMAKLRGYQLSHPDEATEGMNRLAQAFVCLAEAAARQQAPPPAVTAVNGAPQAKVLDDTAVTHKTAVDWQQAPPPVRRPGDTHVPAARAATSSATQIMPVAPAAPPPTPDPLQPDLQQLTQSQLARTGIGTLEALIERIYDTRQLLVAWDKAGVYFQAKGQAIASRKEDRELSRRMADIQQRIEGFPNIIGQPGKPGYRVVAMARLSMTASILRGADELHRELLARDWEAGRRTILAYRKFLRLQFKQMRRQGPMRLVWRAVRFFVNDHPQVTIAAALLLAASSWAAFFWLT